MKGYICQDISQEKLVAYADGELSPGETEQTVEHITGCENCQKMLSALQRSLQVTQVIWQSSEATWRKGESLDWLESSRRSLRPAAVAASILLLLGSGIIWKLLSEPSRRISSIRKEPMAAEIEMEVNRASVAAQMLAVADMFAAQPGGEEFAVKRYNYVINSFSGRDESEQAKLRLQNLLERRVRQ